MYLIFLSILAICYLAKKQIQSLRAKAVLFNLSEDNEYTAGSYEKIFSLDELSSTIFRNKLISSTFGITFFIIFTVILGFGKLFILVGACAFVFLYKSRKQANQKETEKNKLLSSLPLDIEQILMVVQSGLDIIPAISAVADMMDKKVDSSKTDLLKKQYDGKESFSSIIEILKSAIKLADSGELFEKALKEKAEATELLPVRYTLFHLARSYAEGSEIRTTLSELAESTQRSYEENINKIISTLPAKAVIPLVLTFSGLLICFLTSPILQVLKMTTSLHR